MELWIFIVAIYLIYILFFKRKKTKSAGSYTSAPVKAPPKEWLANNKKNQYVMHNEDSEDDNLATFTLSGGRNVEYSITATQRQNFSKTTGALARWILPGEVITVGGVEVTGGYFYLGQRMNPAGHNSGGYYDDSSEASLIDDTLKIYPTSYIYEDSSLGYWPSYSSLSPEARGAYLSWLTSDRCDTSCPIGYVFIYLYGLERRALVDSRDSNISDDEFYSFFLSVVRSIALEKKLVTVSADLSPDRRIHSSGGQARNLYSELMKNMSTRNKPDGNALLSVVERFVTEARKEADANGSQVSSVIHKRLAALSDMVGGYDFAKVIDAFWRGHEQDNETLKSNAIRWLRGEYTTKTDARNDLDVRTIISDASFYDSLKLMSLFVRQAGYAGLLVSLDEMVNLFKLNNTQARTANYEQILRILNDCLQGSAENIGFILGGTPEFLFDPRKGLYSYEALQSRLAENRFAQKAGVIDYSSPTLHLASLTPEELYILLKNLRHVYAGGDPANYLVPDDALTGFLHHCSKTIGDAYFRTPRNTIKGFLDMLAVLEQNRTMNWQALIEGVAIEEDKPSDMGDAIVEESDDDDGLANFRL
ncbi:TPA: TerB N-terminal domain-containing protein [Escherichia coli]|nr:TerB N-terminal domain-containing protein [Escherichia coli]HEI2772523.1 TerB N-terminal domain-containing protein [Escherichia coli]